MLNPKARARAMEDLLIADLDADLTVTGAEIGAIALALSGHARGLLWTRHRRADLDADGRVGLAELRNFADRRALQYLSEGRALALGNLMALDLDGDGQVAVAEAERALVMLNRAARAAQARLDAEETKRRRLASGELGLDIYDMRGRLKDKGLRYV